MNLSGKHAHEAQLLSSILYSTVKQSSLPQGGNTVFTDLNFVLLWICLNPPESHTMWWLINT